MHIKATLGSAAALVLSLAASSFGDTVISPAAATETGGLNTPLRTLPRQYMEFINGTRVGIPGTDPVLITGASLRIAALPSGGTGQPIPQAAWPAAAVTFSNYQFQMSEPSAVVTGAVGGAQFPSFQPWANYQQAGTVTTVYNNALTLPAGSFPYTSTTAATPNAHGFEIQFSTPYEYTPGEGLILFVKHTGFGTATDVGPFFGSTGFSAANFDAVSATDNTSAQPSGFSSPVFWQFTYTAVPEPTALSLLGLGAVGLIRRRRA